MLGRAVGGKLVEAPVILSSIRKTNRCDAAILANLVQP
jgi:hypothetical protein